MRIDREERQRLVDELALELHARLDGGRKNLIVPECIWCGKGGGKMGIYVGPETKYRRPFMAHCFKCGRSTTTLEQLLRDIGRTDLMPRETFDLSAGITQADFSFMGEEEELDDSLTETELPEGYKRTRRNRYLDKRGFTEDDYDRFPVGTTRGLNFKFDDYVVFPITEEGVTVGYVARHTWDKDRIDRHNEAAGRTGGYRIMRYRNSTDNDFVKLLYNYDAVVEGETDTVVLVEGVFDAIALTRKLNLYDNHSVAVVATFGKKISDVQIYKLQSKGVETVVIGYDGDAVAAIKKTVAQLEDYFDVYVADIADPDQDFDSMDFWDIYDSFTEGLMTGTEYKLKKIQRL